MFSRFSDFMQTIIQKDFFFQIWRNVFNYAHRMEYQIVWNEMHTYCFFLYLWFYCKIPNCLFITPCKLCQIHRKPDFLIFACNNHSFYASTDNFYCFFFVWDMSSAKIMDFTASNYSLRIPESQKIFQTCAYLLLLTSRTRYPLNSHQLHRLRDGFIKFFSISLYFQILLPESWTYPLGTMICKYKQIFVQISKLSWSSQTPLLQKEFGFQYFFSYFSYSEKVKPTPVLHTFHLTKETMFTTSSSFYQT